MTELDLAEHSAVRDLGGLRGPAAEVHRARSGSVGAYRALACAEIDPNSRRGTTMIIAISSAMDRETAWTAL